MDTGAAQWEKEKEWPVWKVTLEGDEVPYAPRADERYWNFNEDTEQWEPKAAKDLPKDASLNKEGQVVRVAYCVVTLKAQTEEKAKALALSREQDYHTVTACEKLDG
jgi:hypothetical protein